MRRTHRVIAGAMGASLVLALTTPSWGATPGPGYTWGSQGDGRLGIGSATDIQVVPTAMAAPTGMATPLQFTEIAAGYNHGCALAEDNRAYCWGYGAYGQLGNGLPNTIPDSSYNSLVPVAVLGPSAGFSTISAGYNASCGLEQGTGTGTAYCWGDNSWGQLGDGSTTSKNVPTAVSGGHLYSRISTGLRSTCAVTTNEVAYCWGLNSNGQLGIGTRTFSPESVPVATPNFINRTTANGLGDNTVNGVYATGSTIYASTTGGLSISTDSGATFTNRTTANGLGDNTINGVSADATTTYAATTGGLSISTDSGATFTNRTTANGLGSNTVNGVYASGSTVYAATAAGLSISTNGGTTFTNKTTTAGLGSNTVNGVYADGTTIYAATDSGLSISTDGGTSFTNKTTTAGLGSNTVKGVFAVGSTSYSATTGGLTTSAHARSAYRFTEVSFGGEFACGVTRDVVANVVCWGLNDYGQLGKNTQSSGGSNPSDWLPQPIIGSRSYTTVTTGARHACAIASDGTAYCWGSNGSGQLGIGTPFGYNVYVATPTAVSIPGGAAVRDISAGNESTCAITDLATYCWGSGLYGQLGNGTRSGDASTTVAVTLTGRGINPEDSPAQVTSGEMYNGFVVKPRMSFLPGTTFPSVEVGQSTSTTVTVRNLRPWSMTITGTSTTGAGVSVTSTTCSGVLASTQDCTVTLTWSPTSSGALAGGGLTISYTGNSSTTTLTGTATSRGGGGGQASDPTPTSPATDGTSSADASGTGPPSANALPSVERRVAGPVSRITGAAVAATPPRRVPGAASTQISTAPRVRSVTESITRLSVNGLPALQTVVTEISIGGQWYRLGTTRTGSLGRTTTPAFTSSRPGAFTVRLTSTDGPRYVRVVFDSARGS